MRQYSTVYERLSCTQAYDLHREITERIETRQALRQVEFHASLQMFPLLCVSCFIR